MTCSEEVRKRVLDRYILPARDKGLQTVTVRAGDVHDQLHWNRRVPSVCQALSSRKFQREAGVELVDRSGPPSGLSPTVEFTFRLLDQQGAVQRAPASPVADSSSSRNIPSGKEKAPTLLDLFGSGKEVFRKIGGGENLLRTERADWGSDPWERFEIEPVIPRKKGEAS
jgi:hypothetical protein